MTTTLRLTVLPSRLTPSAQFLCQPLRLTLEVSQCAARFGGVSDPDDTCSGCEDGLRTYQAMRGLRDPEARERDAYRKKLKGANVPPPRESEIRIAHGRHGVEAHEELCRAVLDLVTRAGRDGVSSTTLRDALARYRETSIGHATTKLVERGLIVRGERLGHAFMYRPASAKVAA